MYFLAREGFVMHPMLDLMSYDNRDSADFAIYLPGSAPWHKTECNTTAMSHKLIVLDEFDGHSLFTPYVQHDPRRWKFLLFKRSFVVRKKGIFRYYPHLNKPDIFPMTYSVSDAYLKGRHQADDRSRLITCTLRGSRQQPARLRVQEWISEYVHMRQLHSDVSVGEHSKASRGTVSHGYFELMHDSMIVVTANPSDWEGDFRLWESMASGALVMVDHLYVPHPYPLEHMKHIVYYSNTNKSDLWSQLDYFRENEAERQKIATEGYLHILKYHRTANMADYVMKTAHVKQMKAQKKLEGIEDDEADQLYRYSGQAILNDLRARLKSQGKQNEAKQMSFQYFT
jgi:hypothetical protein